MGITGNLKTMQLAELLQWLSQGKKTGTLVIDDGSVEKRIFFRDGRIISSASSDPREYLGQFMVNRGFITPEELTGAMQMQEKTGMLLGKILVSIGAIDEREVHRLLQVKAEEAIYDIFSWEEGQFEFLDDQLPSLEMVPISLDVTGIVLEGARRLDEWARIRTVVPSMDAIPVTLVDKPAEDDSLSPGAKKVLAEIDDRSTVEQIRHRAHATEFVACQVLFEAVAARKVKVIPSPWEGRAPEGKAGSAKAGAEEPAAAPPAAEDITAQLLIDAAGPHLENEDYDKALRFLQAARALEPFNRDVKKAVEAQEGKIKEVLEEAGVKPTAVPKLARSLEELTTSQLTRNEGFVLSRINGSYDIASISKISSLPELDSLLAFYRLAKHGHVELQQK